MRNLVLIFLLTALVSGSALAQRGTSPENWAFTRVPAPYPQGWIENIDKGCRAYSFNVPAQHLPGHCSCYANRIVALIPWADFALYDSEARKMFQTPDTLKEFSPESMRVFSTVSLIWQRCFEEMVPH